MDPSYEFQENPPPPPQKKNRGKEKPHDKKNLEFLLPCKTQSVFLFSLSPMLSILNNMYSLWLHAEFSPK